MGEDIKRIALRGTSPPQILPPQGTHKRKLSRTLLVRTAEHRACMQINEKEIFSTVGINIQR